MSAEAGKSLIVKCPTCKAVTKVSRIPEDKESIHCPKCKQPVALSTGKPQKAPATAEGGAALPQPTADDYQSAYRGRRRRRRGLWVGVAIGAGISLVIATIVLTYLMPGGNTTIPDPPHIQILKELNGLYTKALEEMSAVQSPTQALDFNHRHLPMASLIQETNTRYSVLPTSDRAIRDEVLRLDGEVLTLKQRYHEGRMRIAKLTEGIDPLTVSTKPTAASAAGTGVAKNSGERAPSAAATRVAENRSAPAVRGSGPSRSDTMPARDATAPVVAEQDKVTVTILNVSKEKATKEFMSRLQALAGGRARILNRQWAGDLLVVEIGPVADLDRFAARLNFGQVTQLDKAHRAITLLARATAVAPDGSLPELPVDPLDQALANLRGDDLEKRRKGALELVQMKVIEPRSEVIEVLTAALEEKDLSFQLAVMKALARWGGADAVDPLAARLSDENPQVRRQALDLLANLKDARVAEAIVRENIVKDREAASAALQALGPRAEPAVLPLLQHQAPEIRQEGCRILRRIGTKAAIPDLLKIAQEARSAVTEAAWDAIETIANRRGSGAS